MTDIIKYKQDDLVLKVSKMYDKSVLNLDEWDDFIDQLCGDRIYQKEAIRISVIYLASTEYKSIKDLALENYNHNAEIRSKYRTFDDFETELHFKDKLYANIDLATGTGKSYVMYGIAQIMLGLGLIDRVLVLCPSLTIESSLMQKFNDLSGNQRLKKSIPESAINQNPRIINADVSIRRGDICIENIHAIYSRTGSSINQSLIGNGKKVLVLNDESHHIFNNIVGGTINETNLKKWKEFLQDDLYDFKYMLGFTGTAYSSNDYFNNVIYRYSLRKAIEDRVVKNIEYVFKDDTLREEEKFNKILQNHIYNQQKYSKTKPLSILVTSNINNAKSLYQKLISFFISHNLYTEKVAKEKVLIVTSHKDHIDNVRILSNIDSKELSYEWVVSVSMLTEGWDVKNVFQIVPWEDRAFNSKLLIAQVLGRGLRLPLEYLTPQPKVIVFNHDSWSKNIQLLINEVLEIEKRIYSKTSVGQRTILNFLLHNLDYTKEEIEVEHNNEVTVYNYSRILGEGIKLESQVIDQTRSTSFESVIGNSTREQIYTLTQFTWHIDDVVNKIFDEFEIRDWEGRILKLGDSEYTQNNLPKRILIYNLIRNSMEKVGIEGDYLIERNVFRILTSFSTMLRKKSSSAITKIESYDLKLINTIDLPSSSIGISGLRKNASIFYGNNWRNDFNESEQLGIIEELINDESLPRWSMKETNQHDLKTPQNVVISSHEPERKFIELISRHENSVLINSWIKSVDKGFYNIEYSWRKNNHQVSNNFFNPDFFIKVVSDIIYIIVIEIKSDKDDSEENKAKYKYGKDHFERLNVLLSEQEIRTKYIFHFLSPNGYTEFFQYLRDGRLLEDQSKFRCELELLLE